MIDKTETQQTLVTLTPAASEKVRELVEQEGDATLGLRIFVAGGGCSGMQYGMTWMRSRKAMLSWSWTPSGCW